MSPPEPSQIVAQDNARHEEATNTAIQAVDRYVEHLREWQDWPGAEGAVAQNRIAYSVAISLATEAERRLELALAQERLDIGDLIDPARHGHRARRLLAESQSALAAWPVRGAIDTALEAALELNRELSTPALQRRP